MQVQMCTVMVKQLPEISSVKQRQIFLRDMLSCMNADRPRMVLDCSNVRRLDSSGTYLLLCCLEEAMKCKGDVKLAALRAEDMAILENTGVGRLFDIYDTVAAAVDSFHKLPSSVALQADADSASQCEPVSAA